MLKKIAYFATLAVLAAHAAAADPLDDLASKAAAAGPVLWYESTPSQQMQPVITAFSQRFPKVKVEHVRDTGGNAMAGRIIQELQSGGRTADIGSNGVSVVWQLAQRKLLEEVDWHALGADAKLSPAPFAIATAATVYVILYNNQMVAKADAPKNWDDLLAAKWQGKLGLWVRAEPLASLAAAWGDAKTTAYIEKLTQQQPLLYKSTFPLAQSVASGEVPVGLGTYHGAQPPIKKQAPISVVVPDPVPLSTIFSFVVKGAKNPDGGKLLAAWLATKEGALAYEKATSRGNALIAGTETAKLLAGKTTAEFPPPKHEQFQQLYEKYNAMLANGGRAAD